MASTLVITRCNWAKPSVSTVTVTATRPSVVWSERRPTMFTPSSATIVERSRTRPTRSQPTMRNCEG